MNIILATDSYKLGHWSQYPAHTTGVYSYLEARAGAEHDEVVFFGLQPLLQEIAGRVVTQSDVDQAAEISAAMHGNDAIFNRAGWEHIVYEHGGRLPVRIKAVAEGTAVPVGNVLMTVENTDPRCFWLTNALESFLLHVWYPITVASLSRGVKKMMAEKLEATGGSLDGLPFMLHDFGYRGVTTHDQAAVGGLAHLVNFMGTDTLAALELGVREYQASLGSLGFSVPATEHSVMTALGREGEFDQVQRLLDANPTGIVSCVADSYNIYDFVDAISGYFKEQILTRDGKFVVRPDSVTQRHPYPADLMIDLFDRLWDGFGGETNKAGFKVLNSKIGLIWGDGIDPHGIEKILAAAQLHGIAAENFVFGMGGGLLQKVNRDTEKFAFKSSAQKRDGEWHDVFKNPLGNSKPSKKGRLMLVDTAEGLTTIKEGQRGAPDVDELKIVFENGRVLRRETFAQIRERAAL
jgi:nicotinamide phosphoribosyltransferase